MTRLRPPDQNERDAAVAELERNVLVLAGAGTGKTRLLIDRLAALILGKEIPVERIVALTFTKKAAEEMRERLEARLREVIDGKPETIESLAPRFSQGAETWAALARAALDDIPKAQIGTIHGFAAHLLRLYPLQAGVDPSFREDEGGVFETVFEREWLRWLAVELGEGAPRAALWHRVLKRGPLSDLRALAVELVSPMIDDDASRGRVVRRANDALVREADLKPAAGRWRDEVAAIRAAYPEKPAARVFNPAIAALELLFSDAATGQRIALERLKAVAFDKPPSGWEAAADDLKRLKKCAEALASVDDEAVREAIEIVRPLAQTVKKELARVGAVSFDGLLVRARNLVRDFPDVRAALKKRFDAFLVDEFQDTDPLQGEILFYLAEAVGAEAKEWRRVVLGPGRLFVVGDPKQSIYRFRGADIAAFEAFQEAMRQQGALAVTLSANFRSQTPILDFANALFPAVMIETPYRQPAYAPLVSGREINSPTESPLPLAGEGRVRDGCDAEQASRSLPSPASGRGELVADTVSFLRIASATDARLTADTARDGEAEAIADRIQTEISAARWRYGDVALLFRSSNPFRTYIEAFRRRGIPYLAEGEKSFYRTNEITDFYNLASAVADPEDRMALAGVLRSPVGGLTDSDLLRLSDKNGLDYRRSPPVLTEEVGGLYARLRALSLAATVLPVPVFLERLLADTGFLELAAAGPGADQAHANLMKAVDLARTWSEETPLTLRRFLRRFSRHRDDQRSEGENPLADVNVDAVRLLTVHKAKGLEFPIVFLPNLNAGLAGGLQDRPVVARDWRSGLVGVRLAGARVQSSAMVRVEEEIAEREKAEEVRVFYVAATRARERMIFVGSDAAARGHASGYFKKAGAWPESETVCLRVADVEVPVSHAAFREIDWNRTGNRPAEILSPAWRPEAVVETLLRRSDEAQRVAGARLFQSPSNVLNEGEKIRVLDDDAPVPVRRALDVGHLCHKVLEEWNFSARAKPSKAALAAALENAARQLELLSEDADRPLLMEDARTILSSFFKSAAYERLRGARFLGKEVPFLYTVPSTAGGESTVMRGVIDALIEIDGRVVIVDYKTNVMDATTRTRLIDHYRPQGEIYREAIRRSTGKTADFELIFLRTAEAIQIPFH